MSDSPIPQPAIPMLGYTSASGEALAPIAGNVHLLQQAADYRLGARMLAASGKWDLVWGTLCFALACMFYRMHIFATALFVLGGLMLAVGFWLRVKPTPIAMLADGTMLLALAAMNAWHYVYDLAHPRPGADPSHTWAFFLFVFTILGAVQRFTRYKSFATASLAPPSKATVRWLDEMHRVLRLSSPARSENMIRFDSSTFPPMSFRAELLPDLAVCLVNLNQMKFVVRSEMTIERVGPPSTKKKFKVQAQLGAKTAKGLITIQSFERFTRWKNQEVEEAIIIPDEASSPPSEKVD